MRRMKTKYEKRDGRNERQAETDECVNKGVLLTEKKIIVIPLHRHK